MSYPTDSQPEPSVTDKLEDQEGAFQCHHNDPEKVIEVYEDDKSYPTYYKCLGCGSRFPVIGDTDEWQPVWINDEPTP